MTIETPLDAAHAAMEAGDEAERRAFFARLADSELYLLLEAEPDGADIAPELNAVDDGQFALVFDTALRLADFAGRPAPYAALPGRVLAGMLAGHDIGLALNPGVAPAALLLPPEAVEWLADMAAITPGEARGRPTTVAAPKSLPDGLFDLIDERLAAAAGLAHSAWLADATWDDGRAGLALAILGAPPAAEAPLAKMLAEGMAFAGLGSHWLDVLFLAPDDALARRMAEVGLGFVLPQPAAPTAPAAPGSDPDRPPRLR